MEKHTNIFGTQDFYSKLLSNDVGNKFMRLQTHEERFILMLENIVQRSAVSFDINCKKKLSEHSMRLRNRGNQSYVCSEFYKAVKEYTESIAYAGDSSEELALAYANRSAALFKLEKYKDCIEDIDRALNQKYPDRLKTKLYKRKGLCLMKLGEPGVDSAFQQALIWLDKMKLTKHERNESESELRNLISIPHSFANSEENSIEYPPRETFAPNPKIPSCSDAVEIKYSKKFGLHVVATRKIKPGEILVLEVPYCKRLLAQHIYTNCSYCLRASWAMIPCNYCVYVAYCSETCKDKAWNEYHEIECSIGGLLLCLKIDDPILLSMRMAIMATKKGLQLDALRRELVIVERNMDPCARLYCDDGKLRSDEYRSIYCGEVVGGQKYSTNALIFQAVSVAVTVCVLAKETKMFGTKLTLDTAFTNNPDVKFLGGLMFKHLHHAAQIKTHKIGSENGEIPVEHGHALMAICSLFNHSCDANALKIWSPERTCMYAAYPIEEGEQIFENYGPDFSIMNRVQRQQHFKRWNFTCDCLPCTENWPLLFDTPSYREQKIIPQKKKTIDKVVQKLNECNSLIQKNTVKNEPNTFNELVTMIDVLSALAKKPCKELIMSSQLLKVLCAGDDDSVDYEPMSQSVVEKQRHLIFSLFKMHIS